jgi:hypothetical protein
MGVPVCTTAPVSSAMICDARNGNGPSLIRALNRRWQYASWSGI